MFFSASQSLNRVRQQLAQMRAFADSGDPRLFATAQCSAWCPSEHLDHIVKVSESIVSRLLQMDAPATGGVSPLGRIILAVGRIPRGRGNAPERLRGARISAAELHASVVKLEGKIDLLSDVHLAETRGPIVPHPRFGGLRPGQALRFAAVHNDHHLRIIEDILRRSR
jgi:hypothetical protein